MKWKICSSEYVHRAPWATLRVDQCEMPDGKIVDQYYVLEYPNWVTAMAITKENKVLMVRQYRHAANIVSLEIPGGVIDGDETPEHAIKRELLEETGYHFEEVVQLCQIYPNPSTANNYVTCFLATGGIKTHEQQLDEHEDILVEEYTIDEVKQFLRDNKIAQALHCTGLFYGLIRLGKL